ncbi:MAG: diguanylate cyclase domain-containing protein [Erythrobacter sp.]
MIIAMGSLATAYCLSSIRFAAILNLVITVVPISVLMLSSGESAQMAAAISLPLATAILVRLIVEGHPMLVDLRQLQGQIRDLAHTDPLTGLANRRARGARIAQLIRPDEGAAPFRPALLALNGFKPIKDRDNRTLGGWLLFALVRPHLIDDIAVTVGASVGVAAWPHDGASAQDLFECADRALYRAKGQAHSPDGRDPASQDQRASSA